MFDIFNVKNDANVYAPVKGRCIDITEVCDQGFASKMIGEGVAIIPEGNIIVSPVDGTISMFFKTGHAFGLKAKNGLELLVHIGIDTVNEAGKGFKMLKKNGEKVKKGTPIVEIDLKYLQSKYDMTTMIVVTNNKNISKFSLGKMVNICDPIIKGE